MIVETSSNQLYAVTEIGLPQAWEGIRVRRAKIRGTYEVRPGAKPELVRKAATKIVSQFKLRD